MDVPTHTEAEAALADARTARTSLAAGGNWLRRYLFVFAAASVPLVLLIGLGGQRGATIGTMLWIFLVSVMSWWGARQRVVLRGHKRRSILAFGGWGVLYGATLLLGEYLFPGQPAFWVPAAVITAVPLVLAACWPTSRGDRRGPGSVPSASDA
jgi:hypothetical protein